MTLEGSLDLEIGEIQKTLRENQNVQILSTPQIQKI